MITTKALRLVITGLVQGVGFRPFVSRLARELRLRGYVRNIGGGEVELWIEGPEPYIEEFIAGLINEKPPPAIIEQVFFEEEGAQHYNDFYIEPSGENKYVRSIIPPDLAICKHCLEEILDPNNRRYMYPFNSCAWCGPRFSMIYKIPYDRENTAMKKYSLCSHCESEYKNPANTRRYHAQGISCPRDGPKLALLDRDFKRVECKDPILVAAKLIDEGYIVGVKGLGGYHIAALATSDDVVLELRRRKKRPTKPFAIMGLNTDVLKRLVRVDPEDELLLNSPQAPILLLPKQPDTPVSQYVSPGLVHEGVFIAYTPLHYILLLHTRDKFLIMTSGNVSGEPMCRDEECAKTRLSKIVDYFLIHDREIVNRVDDSVIRKTGGNYVVLRRSRGYAPAWITLPFNLSGEYIAFGGDLDNVGGVGFENRVVLTQYIGDLDSLNAQRDLVKYLEFLVKSYHVGSGVKPIVVVDKHPRLYSRVLGLRYAAESGLEYVEVQHHYAHVLSTVVDAEVEGKVAGLAIDGVGWGDDGTIWGGEVLVISTERYSYRRTGSIDRLPLTSDRDAYIPIRVLSAYLTKRGFEWREIEKTLLSLNAPSRIIHEALSSHTLVTRGKFTWASSTGRLLDMIMSIIDPAVERTYEGEPAIRLEALGARAEKAVYIDDYRVVSDNSIYKLDYSGLVDWVLQNKDTMSPYVLARSFLYSLGVAFGELITLSTKGLGVESIVLAGGAAVNELIYMGVHERLREEGLIPKLPRRVPLGDGGLALGQVIAADLLARESRFKNYTDCLE
ncbi:MAG: carbamoyltransferase HypF [Desulfurococcaceae archaeon]|jgi:hydrogenase maturation protein HypF|nr:carbamoyltransferase HypF [Desulfurococcaceae archaeon]